MIAKTAPVIFKTVPAPQLANAPSVVPVNPRTPPPFNPTQGLQSRPTQHHSAPPLPPPQTASEPAVKSTNPPAIFSKSVVQVVQRVAAAPSPPLSRHSAPPVPSMQPQRPSPLSQVNPSITPTPSTLTTWISWTLTVSLMVAIPLIQTHLPSLDSNVPPRPQPS
ncbi:hypothetical protein BC829DRAFT_391051, partial [Chytridium lagenaria]